MSEDITVAQLVSELNCFPPEMPVKFAYPSHDHVGRELAGDPNVIEQGNIKWSTYHETEQVTEDEVTGEINEDTSGVRQVVLMRL